jgi:MFS family permease
MTAAESNIGKFYLCTVLGGLTFFHGILGFYLRQIGFSYVQIFSIAALCEALNVVLEIPTGALADTCGLRKTVTVGHAVSAASCFLVALLPSSYALFLGWAVLSAVCSTLNSGSWEALQYESLRAVGREAAYATLRGRLLAIHFAGRALSGVAGGAICDVLGFRQVMLLGSVTGTAMTLVIASMHDPLAVHRDRPTSTVRLMVDSFRAVRGNRLLRTAVLMGGVLLAAGAIVSNYAQPCLERVGTKSYTTVGIVGFALTSLAALASWTAGSAQRRMGDRRVLGLVCCLVVLSLAGLGPLGGWFLLGPLAIAKVGTGLAEPVLSEMVARSSPQGMLATTMSSQNMVFSLTFAGWGLLLGTGLDLAGPIPAFLASAGLLAAVLAMMGAQRRRT